MMVVDELDALARRERRDLLDLRAEGLHLLIREHRALRQRRLQTLHAVGGLADDADRAAIVLELVEMRLDRLLLLLDGLHKKVQRVPARNEGEAVRTEQLLERLRIVRPAMAVLDTVEADLARLAKDLFGRNVGAEALVVVVCPGDGIGAEADHLLSLNSRCSAWRRLSDSAHKPV
ncbi:hypothetical protein D3C80_770610 [compost metagenome]